MQKFTNKNTKFMKGMRVMGTSNTQMMFYTGNSAETNLEVTEDTHQEDREEDSLSNKDIKLIKVTRVNNRVIQTNNKVINKVTRGTRRDNVGILEVKATSEEILDLVTRWILVITL